MSEKPPIGSNEEPKKPMTPEEQIKSIEEDNNWLVKQKEKPSNQDLKTQAKIDKYLAENAERLARLQNPQETGTVMPANETESKAEQAESKPYETLVGQDGTVLAVGNISDEKRRKLIEEDRQAWADKTGSAH